MKLTSLGLDLLKPLARVVLLPNIPAYLKLPAYLTEKKIVQFINSQIRLMRKMKNKVLKSFGLNL